MFDLKSHEDDLEMEMSAIMKECEQNNINQFSKQSNQPKSPRIMGNYQQFSENSQLEIAEAIKT